MKSENSIVAMQYAEAVLELALLEKAGLADQVLKELAEINRVMSATPDLTLVLNHPSVGHEEKRKLLVGLFGGKVDDLTLRLLELLLQKRRIAILPQIETEYRALLNARENIASASLICAEKLSESAVADIKARLTEHLGKKLELDVKVDPSLIGGVVLRLGDQVIDGSIRGKLRNIERALLSV
jgi:F-type H+-transporting ATPase subunit delta